MLGPSIYLSAACKIIDAINDSWIWNSSVNGILMFHCSHYHQGGKEPSCSNYCFPKENKMIIWKNKNTEAQVQPPWKASHNTNRQLKNSVTENYSYASAGNYMSPLKHLLLKIPHQLRDCHLAMI